ncbi:MAG: hypothetical protein IPP72_02975 [Chitinophagaceae bacterium]|nr:hypothetical protein [Chitinophagaceae bacterium]
MISEKLKAEKWGARTLEQISADLQIELPGLKGFSPGNLKKIRLFAEAFAFQYASKLNILQTNFYHEIFHFNLFYTCNIYFNCSK